jgi:hypothetical protein
MGIKHTTVAAGVNDGTKQVSVNAWNEDHNIDGELVLPLAGPATPAADHLALYAEKRAGRVALLKKNPDGNVRSFQEQLSEGNPVIYLPNQGTTVGLNLGCGWTSGGTVSHPTPSTTFPVAVYAQKRTRWANVVTTTNQTLGIHTVTAEKTFWRGSQPGTGGFDFHCRFSIGLWPAATVRLFVGLSDQNTSPVASDTLVGQICGLWHDTTEAATVLNFITRDGSTLTKVPITLEAALAAGQGFDFWMWAPPNGDYIGYRLVSLATGTELADTTTQATLPVSGAFLGPTAQMSNGTANTTVTTTAMEVMALSCLRP